MIEYKIEEIKKQIYCFSMKKFIIAMLPFFLIAWFTFYFEFGSFFVATLATISAIGVTALCVWWMDFVGKHFKD